MLIFVRAVFDLIKEEPNKRGQVGFDSTYCELDPDLRGKDLVLTKEEH